MTIRFSALALFLLSMTTPVIAEPTPGPPEWDDKASIYLAISQQAAAKDARRTANVNSTAAAAERQAPPVVDDAVTLAAHEAPAATKPAAQTKSDRRHLPPPSQKRADTHNVAGGGSTQSSSAAPGRLAEFGVPMQSLYTIVSALAIVLGAFLLFAWAARRSARMSARRRQLPADVVSVLGRVPLAARQFAELLRVGNKLVLVSLTPTGAETLTEVTDPAEVDRLLGLCQQTGPYSTTKAFEQVFQQMSAESAPTGFLGNESLPPSLASPAGAYRAHRGGTRA
jgi:flagellar biogenesis protein FliO